MAAALRLLLLTALIVFFCSCTETPPPAAKADLDALTNRVVIAEQTISTLRERLNHAESELRTRSEAQAALRQSIVEFREELRQLVPPTVTGDGAASTP